MPVRRPLAALLTLALLALGACSDATGSLSELVGETYALTEVNGQPLPFVLAGAAGGARTEIVGETIEFFRFGRARRSRTIRAVDAAGHAETRTLRRDTHYRSVVSSPLSVPGAPLRVGSLFPCPAPSPTALSVACDPDEQGVAARGSLRLSSVAYGAMSVTPLALVFRRASVFR